MNFNIKNFINNINNNIHKFNEITTFDKKKFLTFSLELKFAFIIKIIENKINLRLYDTQIEASYYLYNNYTIDMKTGEGKSLSSIIPLILKTLENNNNSYFISINNYLLQRDINLFKPIFDFFNINITRNLNLDNNNNIIYTTAEELITFYLLHYKSNIYKKLDLNSYYLIDEADQVLIDNALKPIVLSDEEKINKEEFFEINKIKNLLILNKDYYLNNNNLNLTEKGIQKIEEFFNVENIYEEKNYNKLYLLENFLKADFNFTKDIDYIIQDNKIYYIDEKSGKKIEFHSSDFTKQYLEMKNNLEISNKKSIYHKITIQSFFKKIKNKSGMSGTALYEKTFFNFYNMNIKEIKLLKEKNLIKLNSLFFKNKEEKLIEFIYNVCKFTENEESILIGTSNIKDSEIIFNILKKIFPNKENIYLLTAKNEEKESEIINKSGKKGNITIVTQIAGRGVDIKIDSEVKEKGGIILLIFEQNLTYRMDEQIIGRIGRNGDPGRYQFYHSMDDFLLKNYCSKKIKNILNNLEINENGFIPNFKILKNYLNNVQRKHEEIEYSFFENIYKYDNVLDNQRNLIFKFIEEVYTKNSEELYKNILHNLTKNKTLNELINFYKENLNINFQIEDNLFNNQEETINKINTIFLNNLYDNLTEKDRKNLILSFIKIFWKKFLENSEELLDGIHWRIKVNKDPLLEYNKELFIMFNNLLFNLRKAILFNTLKINKKN